MGKRLTKNGWTNKDLKDSKGNIRPHSVFYRNGKILHKKLIKSSKTESMANLPDIPEIKIEDSDNSNFEEPNLPDSSMENENTDQLISHQIEDIRDQIEDLEKNS